MKTKLMILIILFLIFTASIGSALEFMHEESEIARLCSKGYFGGPPNFFNFKTMSNLSQRINGDYPGSTINCNTGAGIFVINARRYYFNNWKIIRMTETGNNSLDYEISEYGRYWKASDGKNYVKVEPDRGLFIDAYLPILVETANMVGKNQVVSFRHNELMKLLNAFYANNKQLGEIYGFANSLLLDPSFRETFLTWSEQYLVNLTPEKIPATSTPKNNDISKVDLKKFESLILGCWDKEKKGDYDAAILDGKQAIGMYDQNPHVHLCVGGSFIQKGDISGKKEFYEQAINYLQKGLAALENFTEKDAPAGEKEFFTERVDYAKSKFQELTAAEKKLTDAKEKEKSSTKKKAKGKK